ncbi:MAG: hypothetical protein QJQ54_03445 [Mollicutes bacterium]|nr:MAG: hypothetical protein QJQ54_03445 [Mollicutes bacterium]
MYAELVTKIIDYLFGPDHSVAVTEHIKISKNPQEKDTVNIFIVPGKKYFSKIIGKGGETINLIENLVRIKGYLNNCQVFIKVEKNLLTNR